MRSQSSVSPVQSFSARLAWYLPARSAINFHYPPEKECAETIPTATCEVKVNFSRPSHQAHACQEIQWNEKAGDVAFHISRNTISIWIYMLSAAVRNKSNSKLFHEVSTRDKQQPVC